jgi:hypothetical protein
MTLEELKDEVYTAMVDKPQQWREGQFVFNYIDYKYQVARQIQFQDNVDCFYRDDAINAFLKCAVERINN